MPAFDLMSTAAVTDALEALHTILDGPVVRHLTDTTTAELKEMRRTGHEAVRERTQALDGPHDLAAVWAADEDSWPPDFRRFFGDND